VLLRYLGPADLYYPTIPLEPEPGLVYELEADPADGHWEHADDALPGALRQVESAASEGAAALSETSLSVNVHPDEEI
jgi:hypothetical protein